MVIGYTLLYLFIEGLLGSDGNRWDSFEAEWTKSGDMVVDDSEAEQEAGDVHHPSPGREMHLTYTLW